MEVGLHVEEVTGKDKDIEVVVDIFNQVNSGGTKLSKGDLALAKICADWPEGRNDNEKGSQGVGVTTVTTSTLTGCCVR